MRKHTVCCLLQTSTSNPHSRGTSPQPVPSSSTKGTRPVWPNFPTNNQTRPFLTADHRPAHVNDRDLDCTHHIPDSGELSIRHYHMFNKTGSASTHSKSGMEAYQGGLVIISVDIVIILLCSQVSCQTYIQTMQPRPFKEWIEKKSKRDTNETPTCAVPVPAPQTNALW